MKLGQSMSDEQKAKISSANKGNNHRLGSHCSDETKAKLSVAHLGKPLTIETRAKLSVAHVGHIASPETRAKMAASMTGFRHSPEARAKIAAWHWKGGQKIADARSQAKRKTYGFNPLNPPFSGGDGHHVNQNDVIYIPHTLHLSVHHNQHTGRGMAQMNAIAYNYLFKQEADAAIAAREAEHVVA